MGLTIDLHGIRDGFGVRAYDHGDFQTLCLTGWIGARPHSEPQHINLFGMSPEQMIELGLAIQTAGAELADRIKAEAEWKDLAEENRELANRIAAIAEAPSADPMLPAEVMPCEREGCFGRAVGVAEGRNLCEEHYAAEVPY